MFLSGSFLGIGSLVFCETQHGFRGPCGVLRHKTGFLERKNFALKMGKMGTKKWAKNRVF